jgi:hypothetical protein
MGFDHRMVQEEEKERSGANEVFMTGELTSRRNV